MIIAWGERTDMAKIERPANIFETRAVETRSPFDIEKLSDKYKPRNSDWTIPQAFLYIIIDAAMVDGHWDVQEEETIKALAKRSRVLRALSPQELADVNGVVLERRANRPDALKEACDTLPADMCLPVFALAVDIVLSDGDLLKPEAEYLQNLVPLLDIAPDHAHRVMEVLLLKDQY
jgi:hypothetical protein